MRIKTTLLVSLLITASAAIAEPNLLQQAGENAVKNAATSAVPSGAIEKAQQASETIDKVKTLNSTVVSTPDAVKTQSTETVTETSTKTVTDGAAAATTEPAGNAKESAVIKKTVKKTKRHTSKK
jgi:hypothetical protein